QQRDKSLQLGRELTDKEFRRFGLNLNKIVKAGELKQISTDFGYRTEDDMLVGIGYGKIAPNQLIERLLPPEKLEQSKESAAKTDAAPPGGLLQAMRLPAMAELAKKLVGRPTRSGVLIGGVDDVLVRFGRCCNPVPGDPIVGFITRGRGVTVHTQGC